MVELYQRNTSENQKQEISNVLTDYKIDVKQI